MQTPHFSSRHGPKTSQATAAVLRQARRLHRMATSESLSGALPILRRVLSTNTLRGMSLPELFRNRDRVQRKHILHTLAVEAGFINWNMYRHALGDMAVDQLRHFDMVRSSVGYPNLWFSTFAQAQIHAGAHGGKAMRVGQQAVVVDCAREEG